MLGKLEEMEDTSGTNFEFELSSLKELRGFVLLMMRFKIRKFELL